MDVKPENFSVALGCLVTNRAPEEVAAGSPQFRLPEDGWWMALATGEHPAVLDSGGSIVQVVDQQARDAIVSSFYGEAKAWADRGQAYPGLLVDYDHFSHDPDKATEAAAWIVDLQNRPDGVYAKSRWTTSGERKVLSGEYRFASAVLTGFSCIEGNRCRPSKMQRVALTNDPNIKGQAPITTLNRSNTPQMNHKTMLAALLGLTESVEDNTLSAAVEKFRAEHNNVPAVLNRLVKANDEIVTVKNRNVDLTKELADRDVEDLGDLVENKDALREQLIANRAGTLAILASLRTKESKSDASTATEAARNRAGYKPMFDAENTGGRNPGKVLDREEDPDEAKNRAVTIRIKAEEIAKNRGISRAEAWKQAIRLIGTTQN